jgi:hypothetical protein
MGRNLLRNILQKVRRSGGGYIKIDLREKGCEDQRRKDLTYDHIQWWASVLAVLKVGSVSTVLSKLCLIPLSLSLEHSAMAVFLEKNVIFMFFTV